MITQKIHVVGALHNVFARRSATACQCVRSDVSFGQRRDVGRHRQRGSRFVCCAGAAVSIQSGCAARRCHSITHQHYPQRHCAHVALCNLICCSTLIGRVLQVGFFFFFVVANAISANVRGGKLLDASDEGCDLVLTHATQRHNTRPHGTFFAQCQEMSPHQFVTQVTIVIGDEPILLRSTIPSGSTAPLVYIGKPVPVGFCVLLNVLPIFNVFCV